jgi:hypothetical protein
MLRGEPRKINLFLFVASYGTRFTVDFSQLVCLLASFGVSLVLRSLCCCDGTGLNDSMYSLLCDDVVRTGCASCRALRDCVLGICYSCTYCVSWPYLRASPHMSCLTLLRCCAAGRATTLTVLNTQQSFQFKNYHLYPHFDLGLQIRSITIISKTNIYCFFLDFRQFKASSKLTRK